jgi:hypothetical protein
MARTREQPSLSAISNGVELLVPNFPRGFIVLGLPNRHEMRWIAGERGKPNVVGDINSATEATREPSDPNFMLAGTNAVSTDSSYAVDGGITIASHGADNDQAAIQPHSATAQSGWAQAQWNSDRSPVFSARFKTGASITNCIIGVGFKLAPTAGATTLTGTTDTDQAFLRYQDGVTSGDWVAWDSNNNTDTTTDTGVAVAVSTGYHIVIVIDSSRVPHYYINGNLVANGAALKAAVTGLVPFVAVQASGAAAVKAVTVRGIACAQEFA